MSKRRARMTQIMALFRGPSQRQEIRRYDEGDEIKKNVADTVSRVAEMSRN